MPFYAITLLVTLASTFGLWFISLGAFISYLVGLTTGIVLTVAVAQNLGRKAKHSVFYRSLFAKLTKYKASVYNIRIQGQHEATTQTVVYDDAHEYAELMETMKGLKIPASQAKDLAKRALSIAKDKPFEEKVRVALQEWGKEPTIKA